MQATILRKSATEFSVVTNILLSDGSLRADHFMKLTEDGNQLVSCERKGHISVSGDLRLILGPNSRPLVHSLAVGDSITLS